MIRRSVQCAVFSGIILVPGLLFAQPPGRGGQQGGMRGGPPTEMIFQLFQQAGPAHGQAFGPGPGEGQRGERRGGRPERPL